MTRVAREQGPSGKSNLGRLLALAGVLLVVAVLVNLSTILQIARGERSFKSVIYGRADKSASEFGVVPVPQDMGSKEAKVTIEVFLRGGDSCHAPTVFLGQSLGEIDPERIRIDFQNTVEPEARKRWQEAKLGCDQGIAVNGKTKYTVPSSDPKAGRKEKVVYLAGGHEQKWSMDELWYILDKELKLAYDGKGMKMEAAEFARRVEEAQKKIMENARAAAKARKESGEAPTDASAQPKAFAPPVPVHMLPTPEASNEPEPAVR